MTRKSLASLFVVFAAVTASADDLHFRNILIGEQAAGLGGAYVAISDDPSGMYYNPAGIMFAMENYFSLSGNAFVYQSKTYKNVLAGQDYKYTSSGLVPTFFGLTQNYGRSKWGFAVIVPNSTTIDQNDAITGISSVNGQASTLKRRLFEEDRTYLIGPAFATEAAKDLTVGISMFGLYRTRNRIDNQLILFNGGRYVVEERTMKQETFGLYPKLGVQYMPAPKMSLGATVAKIIRFGSSRRTQLIEVDTNNGTNPTITETSSSPNVPAPWELAFGGSYFPSKTLLFAMDVLYYMEDKDHTDHAVQATWNVSLGAEKYLTETTALRMGLFTNNSNAPIPVSGKTDQDEHVDLYGISASFAFKSPGSSFTLGTSYSMGNGKGQGIGGNTAIQTIDESRLAVYLTGSYQL